MNHIRVYLNGRPQADLSDWKNQQLQAQEIVAQGDKIVWQLDLGLFNNLPYPIENQTQFLSLALSLEHFRDIIWNEFGENSLGVCIYQGLGDFSLSFPWSREQNHCLQEWIQEGFLEEKVFSLEIGIPIESFAEIDHQLLSNHAGGKKLLSLFCRDVCAEYLNLLATRLPDHIPCSIHLDLTEVRDPVLKAQLMTQERYPRILVEEASLKHVGPVKYGVCLPSLTLRRPYYYEGLRAIYQYLELHQIPHRSIPEMSLTTEWDGLDALVVLSHSLSAQGKRKLLGFCAAGGRVITIGNPIGLPQEIAFGELQNNS